MPEDPQGDLKTGGVVTHYLSKCQWNVKALQKDLSTSVATQMLL